MIYIDNRQEKIKFEDNLNKLLERAIEYSLAAENVSIEYEISLILVDNASIKEINLEFRDINRETDVLSFPMLEYPEHKVFKEVYLDCEFEQSYLDEGRLVLGDIALSLEKAQEQSIDFGHSFERETVYLLVHSILHLLGYDHIEEIDKKRMREREEEILNNFKLNR